MSQKQGQNGAGIVHHAAFQTEDDEDLKTLRHEVLRLGLQPAEIIDRHFFKSVYFCTPAGVLFEMATPGAAAEEAETAMILIPKEMNQPGISSGLQAIFD